MSQIKIHSPQSIASMRVAGRLAGECLQLALSKADVGVSTWSIHEIVLDFASKHGAYCAPLLYRGFPASVCTSLNHVACHGIPSREDILKDGDLLNIDVTLIKDGWHGDVNETILIGKNHLPETKRLVGVAREALMCGLSIVKPGVTFGDLGYAIERFVKKQGMSVVEEYCGHGIGRVFHDEPSVLHVGEKGTGEVMQKGMFFTIEPIINLGKPNVHILDDGWTIVTNDGKLSAQFEHTIAVTDDGCEIFTQFTQSHN